MDLIRNLIFATNNKKKVEEVQVFLPSDVKITTLSEEGIFEDIPEPYETFKENALAKAMYVFNKTGKSCFAEDSGLVVPSLNGAPGVYSARYAGMHGDDEANNLKLLQALNGIEDRYAYYIAVIALVINENEVHFFEGNCEGSIGYGINGSNGFGYDPLFIPTGYSDSFGVLPVSVKITHSHRSKAIRELYLYLQEKYNN